MPASRSQVASGPAGDMWSVAEGPKGRATGAFPRVTESARPDMRGGSVATVAHIRGICQRPGHSTICQTNRPRRVGQRSAPLRQRFWAQKLLERGRRCKRASTHGGPRRSPSQRERTPVQERRLCPVERGPGRSEEDRLRYSRPRRARSRAAVAKSSLFSVRSSTNR